MVLNLLVSHMHSRYELLQALYGKTNTQDK